MVRQRDDLYITVPSFFRCPISLDVMKSPVSLCTGVTYDRSSIERWLESGHDTCPATMQVLHTKDFVPNLTLQRLIRLWSESDRRLNDTTPPSSRAPSRGRVLACLGQLAASRGEDERLRESLSEILLFAKESEENRKFLADEVDGLTRTLVRFLRSAETRLPSVELVVRILEVVLSRTGDRESFVNSEIRHDLRWLDKISAVLKRGSTKESKIAAVRIVEYCLIAVESKLAVAENGRFLQEILNQLLEFAPDGQADSSLAEACLSCLIDLSPPKRVKTKLIDLNLIKILSKLLSITDLSVSSIEKALRLLEAAMSCREGREALFGRGGGGCEDCMEAVVQKLFKVSREATEVAVRIVWTACWLFGETAAKEAVVRSNGPGKVLVVMQSDCSPNARKMCGDLVKVFRKCDNGDARNVDGNRWYSYDTKTTHIMPF